MEVLISIIAKIAEYTVAPIGRQVSYVLFYKGNLKELNAAVKELEVARESIEHLVEVEKRNGKEIEAVVQDWLKSVDDITEEAKQLREDPQHANAECSKWTFPDMKSRHQLSRKAKKIVKLVADVNQKGNFNCIGYLPALQVIRPSIALRSSERLESRHSAIMQIMKALADSKVSKIGVYGLSGVGKTTLMKEVVAKVRDDKLFDAVVMAFVTKSPDIKRIQDEIADQLGLQFEEQSSFGRACRLHDRIKREKSILIILDDLCSRLNLEDVGIPFRDAQEYLKREMESIHPGCKLLLTSKNREVLQEMETEKDFRLEVLNQTESWNLFADMVGDAIKDPSLQSIASEVAKKCNGLPVLIVTIARAVRNKGIHEWKEAIKKLERVDNIETYSALEFCYNSLGSNEAKALFLLCGVEGPSVWVGDLLKYAMGLGIFTNITTVEDARGKLNEMISALQASCLLLEGDTTEKVKMHDIVHEAAISIARRDQHVYIAKEGSKLIEWPTENFLQICSIIKIKCPIHILPERLDCPEIKFFHLRSDNHFLEIPTSFFEGMGNLKVLDLTAMNLFSLPTSFLSLTNLQTLCLDQCTLDDITAIGALKNLEILCLIYSSMTKFPSEIAQLVNLKMLDLSNSGIEVIPPNVISKLTKLEELYMGNTSIKWEYENSANQHKHASLAELSQLPNLTALDLQIPEARMLPGELMFVKLERYKIFIGDGWEWSCKYECSKTLKLKLHTSIDLEYGIKLLLKKVEDLYLDELSGISNVLFQLNGEGFPHLKHLYIQNNAEIKHIVDSIDWIVYQQSFPKLETLTLQNLNNLEKICHGQLMVNSFSNLKEIKVKSCDRLIYLLSCSMANQLPQLLELEVSECKSMKTILLAENDKNVDRGIIEFHQLRSLALQILPILDEFYSDESESPTIVDTCQQSATYIQRPLFSKKVLFSNLETLKLSSINLEKIWEDNQVSSTTFVQDLTYLTIEDCGAIKYLFSSSKVSNFSKLKWLEISKCHMMEEIMATEEESSKNIFSEVQFLKLEKLIIKDMQNLKTIWHPQLTASSFGELKTLEVKSCPRLANVFPSYMQRKFNNLETLTVSDCDSMEVIFQLDANETCSEEDRTELKSMSLCRLPKLKQIWSREPQGILSFQNLQYVTVEFCRKLDYIFPFSVAANLRLLEELFLNVCGLTYVVERKDSQMEGKVVFALDSLTSLYLWNLENLKGFYEGIHNLLCSLLKVIYVFDCYKLKIFKTLSASQRRSLDDTVYGKPLFTFEEVIPNLEDLTLNHEDANMIMQGQCSRHLFDNLKRLRVSKFENEEITFPYWFLQHMPILETIFVQHSSFREIFHDEKLVGGEEEIQSCSQLKWLTLAFLPQLQHICKEGFKIDPILQVVETLYVQSCSSLKILLPSNAIFSYLKYLKVESCHGLINLFTSSVVRSLVKLEEMKIKECNSIEEIVTEKDEPKEEIIFGALKILKLVCLPKLNRFCSSKCLLKFKLLETLAVRQCPRMHTFSNGSISAVQLRKVQIDKNDDGCYWKEDLDQTIRKMFMEKVSFQSFQHLRLAEYPELKELWFAKLPHKTFLCLKSLVVQRCDFVTDSLFSLNLVRVLQHLEELEVRDCDLLEAVFDMEVRDDKEMLEKEISQLKKLTLCSLPRLKHVWKKDHKETLSFPNLREVFVHKSESLESLFPLSIVRELMKIEKLEVGSCGIDFIVSKEEGVEETIEFVFPLLSSIKLWNLRNLKSLYPGKHTSHWLSLKTVAIFYCKNLGIFAPVLPILQETKELKDILDVQRQQPLFFIEKVIPNLECLALNDKDAMLIWEGQYEEKLLHNIKTLALRCFYEQSPTLICSFLQRFSNLEELELGDCSFEMIFPWEGVSDRNTGMNIQIRRLRLVLLRELKNIWSNVSHMDSLAGNLESLQVINCSSLMNLAPPSICFENLTNLYVQGCEGLIYLLTSSTAKSLVKLKTMAIANCRALEHVICTDEEEEAEEEISFQSLESLHLTSLSHLKNFSSRKHTLIFPSLDVLKISGCPKIKMFSPGVLVTPMLKAVTVEEGKKRWKDGLNSTIMQLFQEKVAFHSFKLLELSEYPELKELWYGSYIQCRHHIFANLKSLCVKKCDFLSDVLLSSNLLQVLCNLEELEVTDCISLESLIDVKGANDKEIQMKETSQLKKIKLSGLPNLKHIWNKETHGIISFGNLLTVDVVDCENLESVFPVSLSKDLVQLQEVDIESSGLVEFFSKEDGFEECRLDFPQLTKLRLWNLTKLKCFYPGRHILDCPSLKTLNIYHCGTLQTFSFNHSVFQQTYGMGEVEFPIPQALFPFKKVCPNLELQALNDNDVMTIRNYYYPESLFHRIEDLRIQCFHETQEDFPIDFLQRFPNLVTLWVHCCSFNSLFPLEGVGHHHIGAPLQIRKLNLYKLEQLKYIWNEGNQSVEHTETLDSPTSSLSFKNLTHLQVDDCKEMMYLLTSSVAKSLLQLKSIYIENSESMVDVVKNDEEAAEEIITFKNLEQLTLTSLSSLRSFCYGKQTFIFPSLVRLRVKGCPKMKAFSSKVVIAPLLQSVMVEDERKHWKGDLNTTIQQLFKDKVIQDSKKS